MNIFLKALGKSLLFMAITVFVITFGVWFCDRVLGVSQWWVWVPVIGGIVWMQYKEDKEKA